MSLGKYLREWEEDVLELLAAPRYRGMFTPYVARGTLRNPGTPSNVIVSCLSQFQSSPPLDLVEFYAETDGLDLPCMDAEDGRIFGYKELVSLKQVLLNVTFPLAPLDLEDEIFTSQDVSTSILLTPLIDSALYVWNVKDGRFWALFHHGEDRCYGCFGDLVRGETARILQSLRQE